MNKITIKTLRHYDEIGLLKPAHIDEFTGYRYYTSEQLPILEEALKFLNEYKEMNKENELEFLNKWVALETYRRVVFYSNYDAI